MRRRTATDPDRPLVPPRRNLPAAIACAVIVLAGLAAYSDSFHGPFIFDDRLLLTQPSATSLWPIGPVLVAQRPVAQATFAFNYILGGPGEKGYHVFNVTVHLLAALALFGVVRRTLKLPVLADRFSENIATALAFCTALLWALHPLQTEAVTFIVQRMESLMTLFYLLTLYCFIRAVSSAHPRGWYVTAVVCCLLGMGSKEVTVSAPLIVLLYDRAFVAGSFREALRRRWGLYLALTATWLVLVRSVIGAFGPHAETAGFAIPGLTPLLYAQSEFGVILHYLRLAFWPTGLCLDYYWPVARTAGEVVPGALVVGSLLAITAWALVRRKMWGFIGALFFLVLAPTSSIMPIEDLAFEHRMYLPLAAIAAAAVVAAYLAGEGLMRQWGTAARARKLLGYAVAAGAVLLVAAVLGWLTYLRNADYRTEVGMWQDTARKRPDDPHAWSNLADACLRTGDHSNTVLDYCEKAIALRPDFAEAYNNRGTTYSGQGRLEEAIRDYTKAISLRENFPTSYCNRGNARVMTNEFDAAIRDYDRAIELNPDYADGYYYRGVAYAAQGRLEQALRDYTKAISLRENFPMAFCSLGEARSKMNDMDAAIRDYDRAIALKPDFAEAYCNRAYARVMTHDLDAAIRDYDRAIALKPDFFDAYCNRGNACASAGRTDDAIRDLDKAIALKPDSAIVWYNRGNAYGLQGRDTEALHDYDKAIALQPDFSGAYKNRALIYYNIRDYRSAWADVKMCERLGGRPDPNFLKALNQAAERPK
jgi:tetratricopeptide (TPR) repeat protein